MHDEVYALEVISACIHVFDLIELYFFSKKQIPVIYLVYTKIMKAKSIYQVYTRYIPWLNFLGFPDVWARDVS